MRHSSMDTRNLIITALGSYTEQPHSNSVSNGKTKIITGLASRNGKNLSNYFSKSSDIRGVSLRSYYNSQAHDLTCKTNKLPRKKKPVDSEDSCSFPAITNDLLIVKQSKIALYDSYNTKKKSLRNKYLSFSRSPLVPKKAVKLKIEMVDLKEAMKDKEWATIVKPRILSNLHQELCRSNGIEISCPCDNHLTYKYHLGPGNNSKLLKQCLSQRWWWVRVTDGDMASANLVWTQWREQNFLDGLQSLCKLKFQKDNSPGMHGGSGTIHKFKSHAGVVHKKIVDVSLLGFEKITKSLNFTRMKSSSFSSSQDVQIHNKIDYNFLLSNKKALFYNLKQYYSALGLEVFEYIPMTFHIHDENDKEFSSFTKYYQKESACKGGLWIIKPGENTNRGNGIVVVSSIEEIRREIRNNPCPNTGPHTFILQKYIERPFLIHKRKFDIRCYALVTCINGVTQCYYYEEGYLRTSCKKYTTTDTSNLFIHLTNDAVQKKSENYGKFENGNKLVYSEFQKYLDTYHAERQLDFAGEVIPLIKEMIKDTVQSVFLKLDPLKRAHSFEVFGYDFLLDEDFKPWLIEVNTNPCLELSCSHLARLIPAMIDNALRIAVDPLFPEPYLGSKRSLPLIQNKFELIFHSYVDGIQLVQELIEKGTLNLLQEIDPVIMESNLEEKEEHPESDADIEDEAFEA